MGKRFTHSIVDDKTGARIDFSTETHAYQITGLKGREDETFKGKMTIGETKIGVQFLIMSGEIQGTGSVYNKLDEGHHLVNRGAAFLHESGSNIRRQQKRWQLVDVDTTNN